MRGLQTRLEALERLLKSDPLVALVDDTVTGERQEMYLRDVAEDDAGRFHFIRCVRGSDLSDLDAWLRHLEREARECVNERT